LDSAIANKFNEDIVAVLPNDTKRELTKPKTAVILNEIFRIPNIKPEKLAERVGMDVESVNTAINSLVNGKILSGTAIHGYCLNI
jgi:DNA-binding MarR family transcriptional regulator